MKNKPDLFIYKKEFIGISIGALFLFLTLSLFSYNPLDNSWLYHSTKVMQVKNMCGAIGANAAAMLIYLFGSASYLFLIFLLFLSIILISKKDIRYQRGPIVAFMVLITSVCGLLRLFLIDFTKSYPGGFLGGRVFNLLSRLLGSAGLKIFLFTLVWASLVVLFKISFISFFRKLFEIIYQAIKFIAINSYKGLKISFIYVIGKIVQFIKYLWNKISKRKKEKKGDKKGDEWNSLEDMAGKLNEPKGQDGISSGSLSIGYDTDLFDEALLPDVGFEKFKDKKLFTRIHYCFFKGLRLPFLANTVFCENILNSTFLQKLEKIKAEKPGGAGLQDLVEYNLPDLHMFDDLKTGNQDKDLQREESAKRGECLEEKLRHFGIKGKITAIRPGPVITLFEYKPEIDTKISKIISLEDDLAMALTAMSIRIVAPIPGRSVVGFEISNQLRESVYLQNILSSKDFLKNDYKLPLTLGVDIVGHSVIEDLVGMPHLLVAGSTGSGKSVGLNVMLTSLLCKLRPDQLKLILVDPKRLEFSPYSDIPHLLFPIVTNPRNAAPVLRWLVQEMEDRYDKMADAGVRNIVEYQKLAEENDDMESMPFIILMIDELADLMMVAGKDIETQIARIAQMARAAGIHMIVATQRPSVDVITGLIKVNFPSRVAFRVSSKIDSRTIVDCQGAEKLLGKGDMLFMSSGSSDLKRVHCAYVSDKQVEKLASHLKLQAKPNYLNLNEILRKQATKDLNDFEDDIYAEVLEFLKRQDEISISMLQRQFRIGFNRSARIIEKLEQDGIIAPAQGSKPRKVLK